MIMIGLRRTPIKRTGNTLGMLISFLLIIVVLSGCAAGRGDWTYELTGGYELDRLNAHGIKLCYSKAPVGREGIVISNFYVTDFCMNQSYIGVKGIPTAGMWATDQELESKERAFYLVEVSDGTVYGPYEAEESYLAQCEAVSAGDMGEWRSTKDLP